MSEVSLRGQRAVAFDLGDTLVEYEGVPLSWESSYGDALLALAAYCGISLTPDQIQRASAVLRSDNTRHHPRDHEVPFATILDEVLECCGTRGHVDEHACAVAFFTIFRQRLRPFAESIGVLGSMRRAGFRTGVFTDVSYGMPRELVMEDVTSVHLETVVDAVITSRDCGFRKPNPNTLLALATALQCRPEEMAYVGNEQKDIAVAYRFGCRAILIDRANAGHDWGQSATIQSLNELIG